jgi:CheY-like chemotaxis protein
MMMESISESKDEVLGCELSDEEMKTEDIYTDIDCENNKRVRKAFPNIQSIVIADDLLINLEVLKN